MKSAEHSAPLTKAQGRLAMKIAVLRHIAEPRVDMFSGRVNQIDIRKISEPYRQVAIDLGMEEPPLVDIDGDFLFITPAGRAALEQGGQG